MHTKYTVWKVDKCMWVMRWAGIFYNMHMMCMNMYVFFIFHKYTNLGPAKSYELKNIFKTTNTLALSNFLLELVCRRISKNSSFILPGMFSYMSFEQAKFLVHFKTAFPPTRIFFVRLAQILLLSARSIFSLQWIYNISIPRFQIGTCIDNPPFVLCFWIHRCIVP